MFIRVNPVKSGNTTRNYAQIVDKVNGEKGWRVRVVKHLGPVTSDKEAIAYKNMFGMDSHNKHFLLNFVPLKDFYIRSYKHFGLLYLARILSSETGIKEILGTLTGEGDLLLVMIISRLIEPSSDIPLLKFIDQIYYPWADLSIKKDRIYRLLDKVESNKESIEIELFNRLKPDTSVVHYDLTSSYFEGREDNDLALFGYSRDKKRGKEQIVIGLVMADGIPIYHEVWPGNTVDPRTLESTISVLNDRFHVKNTIIIGDRAFGKNPSLKLLERNRYITAVYRYDKPYRDIMMYMKFTNSDKHGDLFIRMVEVNTEDITPDDATDEKKKMIMNRRYIAVYNPDREKSDIEDLNEKIETVKKKISETSDISDLKKSLGALRSFVRFNDNSAVINERRICIMKSLAGRFMTVTNTNLSIEDIVKAYKEQ